jgi:hypothetical protein
VALVASDLGELVEFGAIHKSIDDLSLLGPAVRGLDEATQRGPRPYRFDASRARRSKTGTGTKVAVLMMPESSPYLKSLGKFGFVPPSCNHR